MFYRLHTDGTQQSVELENQFAGPFRTWCWIICGGPSLSALPVDVIRASPAPKFAVNLAGSGLLRPDFWTSYDPTARFSRSTYLDPGIMKFVHRCRAGDLIPETTFKVCEAPNTCFFDRDRQRGFADFPGPAGTSAGIVDWQDSFVQTIDIAWRLGFRRLLLAGCDMFVAPSEAQLRAARDAGVKYVPRELLKSFFRRCQQQGLTLERMANLDAPPQYHFNEHKALAAAIQTDEHYFRVAQYLRLSRRGMALAGLELISVTPQSRLNDYFSFLDAEAAADLICRDVGDPSREQLQGRYTAKAPRLPAGLGPMRDYRPHFWKPGPQQAPPAGKTRPQPSAQGPSHGRQRLRAALDALPEIEIAIQEIG